MVFILTSVKAAYVHIFLHKLFNVQTCFMSDSVMTSTSMRELLQVETR